LAREHAERTQYRAGTIIAARHDDERSLPRARVSADPRGGGTARASSLPRCRRAPGLARHARSTLGKRIPPPRPGDGPNRLLGRMRSRGRTPCHARLRSMLGLRSPFGQHAGGPRRGREQRRPLVHEPRLYRHDHIREKVGPAATLEPRAVLARAARDGGRGSRHRDALLGTAARLAALEAARTATTSRARSLFAPATVNATSSTRRRGRAAPRRCRRRRRTALGVVGALGSAFCVRRAARPADVEEQGDDQPCMSEGREFPHTGRGWWPGLAPPHLD